MVHKIELLYSIVLFCFVCLQWKPWHLTAFYLPALPFLGKFLASTQIPWLQFCPTPEGQQDVVTTETSSAPAFLELWDHAIRPKDCSSKHPLN